MKYLLANLFSISCAIGAIVVMCLEKDGWGWLLFVGVLGLVTWKERK